MMMMMMMMVTMSKIITVYTNANLTDHNRMQQDSRQNWKDRTFDMHSDCGCSIAVLIKGNTHIVSCILILHAPYSQRRVLQRLATAWALLEGDTILVGNDWLSLESPRDGQRQVSPGNTFHLKWVVLNHVLGLVVRLHIWRSCHIHTLQVAVI